MIKLNHNNNVATIDYEKGNKKDKSIIFFFFS